MVKMKIFLIDNSKNPNLAHPQHILAPLDIGYCASLLEKKGHRVQFIDLRIKNYSLEKILKLLVKEKPDLLLIIPTFSSIGFTKELSVKVKNSVKYIFCYGPVPTVFSELFFHKTIKIYILLS